MMIFVMTHKTEQKRQAFTFIELIVVVIVLGILISLSAPRIKRSFAFFELENYTKNIYFLCNYLQSSSISEAKIYSLDFLQDVREFKALSLKEGGQWEILKGRFGKSYKVPDNLSLEISPVDKAKIFFYPDGSIDPFSILFKNIQNSSFNSLNLSNSILGKRLKY